MNELNKNHVGLALGIFAALLHLIWAIVVAIGADVAQGYLDWIFPLHFVNSVFQVASFSMLNTVILVVLAFIGGYACGWVFAAIYDWVGRR